MKELTQLKKIYKLITELPDNCKNEYAIINARRNIQDQILIFTFDILWNTTQYKYSIDQLNTIIGNNNFYIWGGRLAAVESCNVCGVVIEENDEKFVIDCNLNVHHYYSKLLLSNDDFADINVDDMLSNQPESLRIEIEQKLKRYESTAI